MNGGERGIDRLLSVVSRLRGEQGCPWDREQTLDSLKQYLVEECYELIDAIDGGAVHEHLDELGDVLLQVVLQSQIRKEEGAFEFEDVANRLADKLIRRHPHVFADVKADTSADVIRNWEAIKAQERAQNVAETSDSRNEGEAAEPAHRSVVDGIPRHLPALQRAQRVQSRAARVGFDWDDVSDVIGKVEEELAEAREALASGDAKHLKEELGDLLFATVNFSRFQAINAEEALDAAVKKFAVRFNDVERRIHASGRKLADCTLEEMDAEWDNVKREERRVAEHEVRGK
jgi:tetrapyrrole methylase family protein/MazG family protein